ncbi:rhodanese-like domain-containing protein [Chrysiogenes arsenatis]|uniref:rhodanese-like domain-containing protein n=1 Tax=Chrysiogenes arsenatis TaxID=309797 RepID=UPI000422CBC0|nr:rhodanese-like domain-containing protein [Chrysiogenes arsenatis]
MTRRVVSLIGLLCICFWGSSSVFAQVADLNSEELKQRIESAQNTVVVDTRSNQEYVTGHISGAINITSQESNMFSTIARFLPPDKETTLIFYCRGYNCSLAPDAAMAAYAAGYRHVYTYRGGYPDWQAKGYPIVHR